MFWTLNTDLPQNKIAKAVSRDCILEKYCIGGGGSELS